MGWVHAYRFLYLVQLGEETRQTFGLVQEDNSVMLLGNRKNCQGKMVTKEHSTLMTFQSKSGTRQAKKSSQCNPEILLDTEENGTNW